MAEAEAMTPEQLARVDELAALDKITLAVRLMKAEEQLKSAGDDSDWDRLHKLLTEVRATVDALESGTANPERQSSPGHSEVKPDGQEGRSGAVDREGGGRTATTRGDAVGASGAECGSRPASREADQGEVAEEGAASHRPALADAHGDKPRRSALVEKIIDKATDWPSVDTSTANVLTDAAERIEQLERELAKEVEQRHTSARVDSENARELLMAMGGDPALSLLENAKRLRARSAAVALDPRIVPEACPKAAWKSGTNGRWPCEYPKCNCSLAPVAQSASVELTVRQAIIDWNRSHVEPGRPFPPLNIDQHQEGSLAEAVLTALRTADRNATDG